MATKNPSDFWRRPAAKPVTVIPCLAYSDAKAAIRMLTGAFGFHEHLVVEGEGGRIEHAQLSYDAGDGESHGGMVMLSSAGDTTPSPATIYVIVADTDAHCATARAAGAKIIAEPTDRDYGGREYTAIDDQGHRWTFGTYDPFAAPSGVDYHEDDELGVIELKVAGRVAAADFEAVAAQMEAFFERHEKARLIEVIESFDGMDWSLLFDDLLFSLRHLSRFSHVAVVTELRWAERMANAAAVLLPAKLRVFPLADLEDARRWARTAP